MSLPFLKIAATEIVSGVSGESEEKIRDLFEQAMVSDTQTCIPTTRSCPLYLYLVLMMCLYLSIITLAYCQLNLVMLTIYTDITVHWLNHVIIMTAIFQPTLSHPPLSNTKYCYYWYNNHHNMALMFLTLKVGLMDQDKVFPSLFSSYNF